MILIEWMKLRIWVDVERHHMDENMNASDHMIVIGDMDKLASFAGPSPTDTSKLLSVFTTHLPRMVGHFGKGIVVHSFHRRSCHFQMS
jgi:hypothetical protein